MSEWTNLLKVGVTDLVLRMVEENTVMRDLTLENPIRAIREISHDITCRRKVRLANGRELSALEIQSEYLTRAQKFAARKGLGEQEARALGMWEHVMAGLESDALWLSKEIDWVIKYYLVEQYRERHSIPLTHPKVALVGLAYHDVNTKRSRF